MYKLCWMISWSHHIAGWCRYWSVWWCNMCLPSSPWPSWQVHWLWGPGGVGKICSGWSLGHQQLSWLVDLEAQPDKHDGHVTYQLVDTTLGNCYQIQIRKVFVACSYINDICCLRIAVGVIIIEDSILMVMWHTYAHFSASRCRRPLGELLGRVTSQTTASADVWRLYAEFHLTSEDSSDHDKVRPWEREWEREREDELLLISPLPGISWATEGSEDEQNGARLG